MPDACFISGYSADECYFFLCGLCMEHVNSVAPKTSNEKTCTGRNICNGASFPQKAAFIATACAAPPIPTAKSRAGRWAQQQTANSGYTLADICCTNVTAHAQAVPSKLGVWALGTHPLYAPLTHHACNSPLTLIPDNPAHTHWG